MKSMFVRFVREEEGQDLIEYALLAGLIAVVAITAITLVGTDINLVLKKVTDALAAV